jgi:hypothetical protein
MDDIPRNNLIEAEIGPALRELLMDELHPLVADFGWLNCGNFRGKGDPAVSGNPPGGGVVTLDTEKLNDFNVPAYLLRYTVAHELGHVLLGAGHDGDANNLMHDPPGNPPPEALRSEQCGDARDKALAFAQRFHTYNVKVGRIPPYNGTTPSYPNGEDTSPMALQQSCCQIGAEKNWYSASACLGVNGVIFPDGDCSECCEYAQSPENVDWTRLGACAYAGGTVIEHYKCGEVCCRNIQTYAYQKMPQAECVYNGEGKIVEKWLCDG